jgi:hypothetical protein
LQFFEQGDSIESGIGLQQGDDLAVPDRFERVFSGAPVPLCSLRDQALPGFDVPGASLADSDFGSCCCPADRLTGQHSCRQPATVIVVNHTVTTSVVPRLLKSARILGSFATKSGHSRATGYLTALGPLLPST